MHAQDDKLTLLIRPGERLSHSRGLPTMRRVVDPGPSFPGLRRFFRPWRMIGKVFLVGVPCWIGAVLLWAGGWIAGPGGLSDAAAILSWLPLAVLALWAGVVGAKDLAVWGQHRQEAGAYRDAVGRLGDADVLTPTDLRSPGIREGLVTLGHFEHLIQSVERDRGRISALLCDSLSESRRLVQRSVIDLVATERRLTEWTGRLGEASTYKAKLEARRDQLAGSYAGILDQCLHAADRALAHADDDPADLERTVNELLGSCQRALAAVEHDGPAIDEQELLMYAAKAREAGTSLTDQPADRPGRVDD